jgi:internalin A
LEPGKQFAVEKQIEEARETQAKDLSLDLSDVSLADISFSGLQGLESLRFTGGVVDLPALSGLHKLRTLTFGFTALQLLGGLPLDWPSITDLTPLASLHELEELQFRYCPGLTDVSPLAGLAKLHSLILSHTGVVDVSPLAGLQSLRSLDLSHSGVTEIAVLAGLPNLQSLDLFGCRLTDLAALFRIVKSPSLEKLYISEVAGIPPEILSQKFDENCLERLSLYLSELALGAEAENEVKVILLGNGGAGKTQLCRRFRAEPFDEAIETTHGVQIWRKELRLQAQGREQIFQVNWWDFGGQDIYHGTHALFLRSRAVFLILWTPELENREEYEENGIPLRNQPLSYWLDYVRALAGEGSPVIIVQSKCDQFADQRSLPSRLDSSGFFQSCSYSAKTELGRDLLEAQLREALRYLLDRNSALQIGHGRAEVRRRLYDWRSKDQKRKPEKRRHQTLTLEEFRALCDEVGGILSWEHALDYFAQTGVVFYRPDLFDHRIILDQNWALDAVYTVFHRGRVLPWLRDSGRFTREDLAAEIWQKHSVEEQELFLRLMESCGVCFSCGTSAQGEKRYIAPDLLPRFEVIKDRLYAWKDGPGLPALRLEYRFLHPAIIRGLMRWIGPPAESLAEYWKYGLWLKDGKRDTQLLVQFEDTSTDETPGAGALLLKAQGGDPQGLLREILRPFLWQHFGEEQPEEWLTLEGLTVARKALASAIHGRVLDIQGKPVPAAAFAAFWDQSLREAGKSLDISPQALSASEKPSVFLSYSHKDVRPLEPLRIMLAPHVRNGTINVWWDGEIKPSQLWREEISKALTAARIGVLWVTPNFLASDFIAKNELPHLIEAAKQQRVTLFWILASSCSYEETPLVEIQAAHDISKPLDLLGRPKRTAVLKEICRKIAEAVKAPQP